MALGPEHPKGDQNQKFTPLSETTSIPVFFIWESPPRVCGMLVYSDVTSSETSKALSGRLSMAVSLLRKSVLSLTNDGIVQTKGLR